MNVGDVHWVELAPRGGHAQAGRRPAIIAQSVDRATTLPTVLLIPLTTQMDALRFPGTVLIEADAQNGLRRHSVALVFQLTAVDRRFVAGRLGEIADATLRQIWAALDELTGRV
ncbi:MAG TPA: type II toxin-antitoxin system PemK/MazF family toxin [Pyrinomonadaceae bacterium]|nr:type II toxin-antitoxin system PemK/MazF family toxin [Pyrinomonadaceae bacterium]